MGLASIASIGNDVTSWVGAGSVVDCSSVDDRDGSSAASPLPSALRCLSVAVLIGQYLLGELDIALSALRPGIVHENRLAEAGSLGEANAARNDGFEHFILEELFDIVSDLSSQVRSLVVHCQQDSFDF